jgi:hypothetical protein
VGVGFLYTLLPKSELPSQRHATHGLHTDLKNIDASNDHDFWMLLSLSDVRYCHLCEGLQSIAPKNSVDSRT